MAMVGTRRTAVVKVNEIEYGTCTCSRARPTSSAEVVMKRNEKADMMAKKRVVKARAEGSEVPKMTFMTKMKNPRKSPPRMERSQRLTVRAKRTPGI